MGGAFASIVNKGILRILPNRESINSRNAEGSVSPSFCNTRVIIPNWTAPKRAKIINIKSARNPGE